MSVGFPITKAELDNRAGTLARGHFSNMEQIKQFKGLLDGLTTEALVALTYTEGEVALLKSAYGDLAEHASVFDGNAPLYTAAHDFRAFAIQLLGAQGF